MNCSYCSKQIRPGTGTMYVSRIGAISYFCSSRCYTRQIELKRKLNPKEIRKSVAAVKQQKK
ncbi:MAG: 50S ribosomal protein L24e [Candidatus Micrarchaeota archaeon]|nr:50S ribosomal protein L24e [Candidatus Micrarchaeota archaeon]